MILTSPVSYNINRVRYWVLWFFIFLFISCTGDRVYETNIPIENHSWDMSNKLTYSFEIDDTNAFYNVYINTRHNAQYSYSNLWINVTITYPDNEKVQKRIELLLADRDGKWFGNCMGDLCDLQLPFQQNTYFNKTGTYIFEIEHSMRQNPLPNILEMGVRIEKILNSETLIKK